MAHDPLQVLSALVAFGMMGEREFEHEDPILQFHVEIVQGLLLRQPTELLGSQPLSGEAYAALRKLILEAVHTYDAHNLAKTRDHGSVEHPYRGIAVSTIRSHTVSTRNWGYTPQVLALLERLFEPLENAIESHAGVRVSALVRMWMMIVDECDRRRISYMKQLWAAMQATTIGGAIKEYERRLPQGSVDLGRALEHVRKDGLSVHDAKKAILEDFCSRLPNAFTFTQEDLIRLYPGSADERAIGRVLSLWSARFGDAATLKAEHVFLANPVWTRPMIQVSDGIFFWPLLILFQSRAMEMIEMLFSDDAMLFEKYRKRRSAFLEEALVQHVREAFPSSKVWRGSVWRDPSTGEEFENDLTARVDSHLLIIEAKAGKVAESARRGAELRLQRVLDDLVVGPSVQSARFAAFLNDGPSVRTLRSRQGGANEIDVDGVRHVIRVNVTLEDIGLHIGARQLKEAGLIEATSPIAPTMALADLECVLDILELECDKLHYLARRADLEAHTRYHGDEIDLLGLYIGCGLNIGEMEFGDVISMLTGCSRAVDEYYVQEYLGRTVERPRPRRTRWWNDMLCQLERNQVAGYSSIGRLLLMLRPEEQHKFEDAWNRVRKNVASADRALQDLNIAYFVGGSRERPVSVVGYAHKAETATELQVGMKDAGKRGLALAGTDRSAVIALDVARLDYPYSAVGCVFLDP